MLATLNLGEENLKRLGLRPAQPQSPSPSGFTLFRTWRQYHLRRFGAPAQTAASSNAFIFQRHLEGPNGRLPYDLEFDTSFYYVSKLSSENVGASERVDARLAWHPREHLELSVVGQNLFEGKHREFGDGFFSLSTRVPRSVYGKVTWRY